MFLKKGSDHENGMQTEFLKLQALVSELLKMCLLEMLLKKYFLCLAEGLVWFKK